ncbi:MAG: hypothetical protein AAFY15_01950, partial [Cyanobacteria bacterium J06648_11]
LCFSPSIGVMVGFGSEVPDMSTAKDDLRELLKSQPDDSSPEELVRELAFHLMIQRGLGDSDAGRTISNEDLSNRIRSWGS